MNITVLVGSVRDNRLADKVLNKVKELLEINYHLDYTIVDPLVYNLPLLNKRYFEMENPGEKFVALHELFLKTDGFIIITPEYNHSVPPALKNMLDHFYSEFKQKACGIISYSTGAIGGARAAQHLRLICSELGMPPIPKAPALPFADKINEPEGKHSAEAFEKSFKSFIKQLLWYTEAFMAKRAVMEEQN